MVEVSNSSRGYKLSPALYDGLGSHTRISKRLEILLKNFQRISVLMAWFIFVSCAFSSGVHRRIGTLGLFAFLYLRNIYVHILCFSGLVFPLPFTTPFTFHYINYHHNLSSEWKNRKIFSRIFYAISRGQTKTICLLILYILVSYK